MDLEELYKAYPRKMGKKLGMMKLKQLVKTKEVFDQVMLSITNYSRYIEENQTESRYIKYFSSFITSWEDWLEYPDEISVDNKNENERMLKLL